MVRSSQKRAHRRALDRHGQAVTHRTYTQSGSDDYGDPTSEGESTETVTGRVVHSRTPQTARSAGGDEVDVDVSIIVSDEVTIGDIDEGSGRPDEFTADGVDYVVLVAEDQDNGLITCRCARK